MKPQAMTRDPSPKEPPSSQLRPARRDAAGGKDSPYELRVCYYATMKPQRVYPLVVEVVRGQGAADGPSGVTVTLRPVVPGALVAPAELPLEVARPGAQATFHVTPVAKGRLPEACVRVLHGGRTVQELRTRMTAKTQRTTWVLLLLALILPALVVHWTITNRLSGTVPYIHTAPLEEAKNDAAAKGDNGGKRGGGGGGGLSLQPPVFVDKPEIPGSPGEILKARMSNSLRLVLPNFPHSDQVISNVASPVGTVYDIMCQWSRDVYLPWWLGVGLLIGAFGSWTLHKPTRVRIHDSLALPRPTGAGARFAAETGETLPLAPPQDEAPG
jgi:hypothetical protein